AAELMVPRWFDKRAGRSAADNVRDLAASLELAIAAYVDAPPAAPFELSMRHTAALQQAGARAGFTELTSAYGQAVLDRAVLDAVCRALEVSVFELVARNGIGMNDSAPADLQGFDW